MDRHPPVKRFGGWINEENSTGASRVATIDDIESDLGHLNHLLDAVASTLMDMDFGVGRNRNHQLDRVNALVWIGRDISEKLVVDCGGISAKESRRRAAARNPDVERRA